MKKNITFFMLLVVLTISAQSKYETGMLKAFDFWKNNKTTEASQLFERITNAEKKEWLPPYYVATLEIITSFGLKDATILDSKLKKAQQFLDMASTISPDNPEIIITQALLNTAYISFDGQKYGMTLSTKNNALYKEALKIAPNNARVILGKAEWDMGTAQFFGQSIEPFCKDVEKTIPLFEKEKLPKFYPSNGINRAKEVLKKCKVKK